MRLSETLVALSLALASCCAPPDRPPAVSASPVAAPPIALPPAPAPAAAAEVVDATPLVARLAAAYDDWRRSGESRALRAVADAERAREVVAIGPGLYDDADAVSLSGDGTRALLHVFTGVLYVDAVTGEPLRWIPYAAPRPLQFVDGGLVRLRVAYEDVLQRAEDAHDELRGPWIALGEKRAYLFEGPPGCAVRIWDRTGRSFVGELRRMSPPSCDHTQREPHLTPDGAWLVTVAGRWSLATGRFERFTGGGSSVISDDGRYLAYLEEEKTPERPGLVIVDLRSGRRTRAAERLWFTTNPEPLRFVTGPTRVVYTDYGMRVFAVPSGRLLGESCGFTVPYGDPCERPLPPLGAAELAVVRRVGERVCHVGALVLPRAACEGLL